MNWKDYIGNTPLVTLRRLGAGNRIDVRLEGDSPAGSVEDRSAFGMIHRTGARGEMGPDNRPTLFGSHSPGPDPGFSPSFVPFMEHPGKLS